MASRDRERRPPPSGRAITDDGEILTAVDVERMIASASKAMDSLRADLERQAREAAQAEHEWKVARAKARTSMRAMGGNGPGGRATEGECDDYALELHEPEHLAYVLTESLYDSTKSAVRMVTSQMDGLRTIAANIRAQT